MANFEDYLNDYDLNGGISDYSDDRGYQPEGGDYGYNDGYGDREYSDQGYSDSDYTDDFAPVYSNAKNDFSDDYGDGSYNDGSYDDKADYDTRGSSYSEDEYDDEYEDGEPGRNKKSFKPSLNLGGLGSKISGVKSNAGQGGKLLTVLMVISVALSLVSLISVGSLKSSIKETKETLSAQIASLSAATGDLAERVSSIESGVTTVQQATTSSGVSKYITIAKQPTSVSSYVGRGEDSLAMFFSVAAKGNGITMDSFVWQKQDASGTWINVGFDGVNSKNDSFGLQNEVGKYDSGDYAGCYYSIIYSYGLTSQGFGQYRCVVSDSTGEQTISDVVEIRNNG